MKQRELSHIEAFTLREERLLARARAVGLELPERLAQWTLWIQDSELYLNELRNAVVDAEKTSPMPKHINCPSPKSSDGEHDGYWINEETGNFRCYHCGFQFHLKEMDHPTPKNRIETWKTS